MNEEEFRSLLKDNHTPAPYSFVAAVSLALLTHVRRLGAQISALEKLQKRRTMSFEGPHDPGKSYVSGDVVQRSGSLFVALLDTGDAPGDSAAWRKIGVSK